MHSRKMWDTMMILMVISFVCLVIYANIDTFNNKMAEDINSKKSAREVIDDIESKDVLEDTPIQMYISEPFFSEEELNEMADLVIIGQIADITKDDALEVKGTSDSTINLNIPYIIYDVNIIESIKNSKNESNVKVKCMYGITYGYNPREIKQGDLYKFYLSNNKEKSYSPVNYRNGIQKFTED